VFGDEEVKVGRTGRWILKITGEPKEEEMGEVLEV
jgi:hypothetical protein